MSKEVENSARDLLLQLIHSNMSLARAFAAVARLRYDQGNDEAGEFARCKALKFHSEARRLLVQLAEEDKQSDSSELQKLRDSIVSLSSQLDDSQKKTSPDEEQPAGPSFREFLKRLRFRRK